MQWTSEEWSLSKKMWSCQVLFDNILLEPWNALSTNCCWAFMTITILCRKFPWLVMLWSMLYQSRRGAKVVLYYVYKCHNDYVLFTCTWTVCTHIHTHVVRYIGCWLSCQVALSAHCIAWVWGAGRSNRDFFLYMFSPLVFCCVCCLVFV